MRRTASRIFSAKILRMPLRARTGPPLSVLLACAMMLAAFAVLSYRAAATKSVTYDETLHAPAAYTHLRYFDFRANPEHPPLWKYWAALPWLLRPPADPNVDGPAFASVAESPANHWTWAADTLYRTPGNDAGRLIAMSRAMMIVPAVALGAVLAWWAYRLGGPVAAVVACAAYSLDPNFLAHAPLVTNDVSFTLAVLLVTLSLWSLGRRITVGRVAMTAVCCAAAFVTKFTAILLAPVVVLTLVTRSLRPEPWATSWSVLDTRRRRLLAALALSAVIAVTTYVGIWAAYGFRFRSAPDPAVRPDLALMERDAIANEIMGATGHGASEDDIRNWRPTLFIRGSLFAIEHRLLPEAFAFGLLHAYARSLYAWSYCLGTITGRGHWYYFPLAFLVKTPLTTLGVIFGSVAALVLLAVRRRAAILANGRGWLLACLAIPFAILGLALVRSHMNIGLRHAFPLYPTLFLLAGLAAAKLYALRPKVVRPALAVLGVALATETVVAYPNYIPFLNAAAGGYRGGFRILGDSNLDWGQDLPLLADWQRRNPDRTLYLAYQGTADPAYYGIRYTPLTLNTGFQVTRREFPTSGVVAASATMLQNDWLRPAAQEFFHRLRDTEPDDILGGSIYIFDLDRRR